VGDNAPLRQNHHQSTTPLGPSESFAVVCTLVHCNCFVSILFAMPIPDYIEKTAYSLSNVV